VVVADHLGHQAIQEHLVDLGVDQRALHQQIILAERVHQVKEIMAALDLLM
jgi:hypothetical protein